MGMKISTLLIPTWTFTSLGHRFWLDQVSYGRRDITIPCVDIASPVSRRFTQQSPSLKRRFHVNPDHPDSPVIRDHRAHRQYCGEVEVEWNWRELKIEDMMSGRWEWEWGVVSRQKIVPLSVWSREEWKRVGRSVRSVFTPHTYGGTSTMEKFEFKFELDLP